MTPRPPSRACDLPATSIGPIDIAVIGDRQEANPTHISTDAALGHAAESLGVGVVVHWVGTDAVGPTPAMTLASFAGFVIAPGSPYRRLDGAIAAIRFARARDVPLLATCGGFQHVILEFARNVLGVNDAQHAEYDPYASDLFITPLSCSLAGQTMAVQIASESRAGAAYPSTGASERYYCNFGLNPAYRTPLEDAGLFVSGVDTDGEVRIVELPDHRFFVATLFVPQTSSSLSTPHPLVQAFLTAAVERVGLA